MSEDMKKTAREVKKTYQELQKELPEFIEGWSGFTEKYHREGALTERERELIAVALSASKQCHWCVAHHVKSALNAGATREEVLEAAFETVLMGGGPALVHMRLVLDALADLS